MNIIIIFTYFKVAGHNVTSLTRILTGNSLDCNLIFCWSCASVDHSNSFQKV